MKVTQNKIREFFKRKLSTNPAWALRGLIRVYERQTLDEQAAHVTRENNGVGFSGVDAEFLSSLAEQYQRRGSLSDKQMALLFKKMPRYWKQISSLVPQETIESLILTENKQ